MIQASFPLKIVINEPFIFQPNSSKRIEIRGMKFLFVETKEGIQIPGLNEIQTLSSGIKTKFLKWSNYHHSFKKA